MRRLLIIALLLLPTLSLAQSSSITLNVTDTDGQVWVNGKWSVALISKPGVDSIGPPFKIASTGIIVPNQLQSGSLDASGNATFTVTRNDLIAPIGSTWRFVVCPLATSDCYRTNVDINASPQPVNLIPPAIRITGASASPTTLAYTDTEISTPPMGIQYFNIISFTQRQWTGSAWTTIGAGGGGTPNWGAIIGVLSNQTDLQNALNAKAPITTPSFTGQIGIDTPSFTNCVLFNNAGVIDCVNGFSIDPTTGALTYPSAFQLTSTFPNSNLSSPDANHSAIGFDTNGDFKICERNSACFHPGLIATFPDGSVSTPGFASTNHPELGISTVLSSAAFSITNVQRTTNVVTITVTTTNHALTWPVGGTISVFGLPTPFDVLNCANCTLTAVTGSTPTSTFTYTLSGTDVASSATTGSAAIYNMFFNGYAQTFGRLYSNTSTGAAHRGSIAFAKNDDIWHRSVSGTTDYLLMAGANDQAQLGDPATGSYLPGQINVQETAIPSTHANGAGSFGISSTTHKFYCSELGVDCMPPLPATVVQTNQSNTYTTGTQDLSGAAHTLPALKGTTAGKPATCTQGELYFATDATAGQNLFMCTAANTWTQQLNSGGGINPLLNQQGNLSAITGTGAAIPAFSFTVPGNTIGINDCIRVSAEIIRASGTDTVTYSWTFGATSLAAGSGTSAATVQSVVTVCNQGATNSQLVTREVTFIGAAFATSGGPGQTTAAIDTTVNQDIDFKFSCAATSTVQPVSWIVEYLKHQ